MGPALTLVPQLFSLPIFVVSVVFVCQAIETTPLRYLIIVSYAASFIPQMTTFFLYISPSSFYKREWYATNISKWLQSLTGRPRQALPTGVTIFSTMKEKTRLELTAKID